MFDRYIAVRHTCMYVCMYANMSVCQYICRSICLSVNMSVCHLLVHPISYCLSNINTVTHIFIHRCIPHCTATPDQYPYSYSSLYLSLYCYTRPILLFLFITVSLTVLLHQTNTPVLIHHCIPHCIATPDQYSCPYTSLYFSLYCYTRPIPLFSSEDLSMTGPLFRYAQLYSLNSCYRVYLFNVY